MSLSLKAVERRGEAVDLSEEGAGDAVADAGSEVVAKERRENWAIEVRVGVEAKRQRARGMEDAMIAKSIEGVGRARGGGEEKKLGVD